MALRRRPSITGLSWFDNWPRPARLPLVQSRAGDALKAAIRRYVAGEISGRAFLIAGHRGAGKTTLVRRVVDELIDEVLGREDERAKSPILPDSILAMPQRPLLVRLHGPSLLLDELPGPGAGERPPATAATAATADVPEIPDQASPDKPPAAQSTLVQVTIALWRALAAECAGAFFIHARGATGQDRQELLEIAAQIQLELDQAPDPATLRGFWYRFHALDQGVLWPQRIARAIGAAGFGGQGLREIVAVATVAQIFEVCAGKVEFTKTKKDKATAENRAGADKPQGVEAFWAALPGLGLGAALGAGAAGTIAQSVPASLAGALLGALALSWSSTRSQSRETGLDYRFILDRSVTTLERDLPVAIQRIRQAGLAPVFVVDELDKVADVDGTIRALIGRLKQLTTDDAFFCFLTDRDYFARVQKKVESEAYPLEHTFFSERLYVLHTPGDFAQYIATLVEPQTEPPPGVAMLTDQKALLVLAKLVLHESKLNMIDAVRTLAGGWRQDVWDQDPEQLVADQPNRLRLALQLAVEHVLRARELRDRAQRDGNFRQLLVDTLYIVSRAWEQDGGTVDLQRAAVACVLLQRLGKTPGDDPLRQLVPLVDTSDFNLLIGALRKLHPLLCDFDFLRAELRGGAAVPEALLELIPAGSALLRLDDEQTEFVYRFVWDQFGRDLLNTEQVALGDSDVATLTSVLAFVDALRKALAQLGLGLNDTTKPSVWFGGVAAETMGRRQRLLAEARGDQRGYPEYAADLAALVGLQRHFGGSSRELFWQIAIGIAVAHDSRQPLASVLPLLQVEIASGAAELRADLVSARPPVRMPAALRNLADPGDGFASDVAGWVAALIAFRERITAESPIRIDWELVWERRANKWLATGAGPSPDDPDPPGRYEDLVLSVQPALPVNLLRLSLRKAYIQDRSLLALQAAMSAVGFEAAEELAVPPWITVPALHALGFGGDVLGPVAEAVKAENQSNFVKELLWTLPKAAAAGKGVAVVVADTSSSSTTAHPPGAPVFFISKDQLNTYDPAIRWLTGLGVFEGVIDEHTAGQDPPGEQPAASG